MEKVGGVSRMSEIERLTNMGVLKEVPPMCQGTTSYQRKLCMIGDIAKMNGEEEEG